MSIALPLDIRAAVVREPNGAYTIERARITDLRDDEVLVRVVACGLCHTDIVLRSGMRTPLPLVSGHEGSGVVEAVGASVTYVKPGDHVVMTYLSCGMCRECEDSAPASCTNLMALCFRGCRPDGSHAIEGHEGEVLNDRVFGQSSFATHAVANERNLVKVAPDLPLELLGPLGCGIITGAGAVWNELDIAPGASIAIFGAGAVGLSAVMAARIVGAATIIAIDKVASRLDLARELGATHCIDGGASDCAGQVRAILAEGVDFAFDTTGVPAVILTAVQSLRQRGVLGLVAPTGGREVPLDVGDLIGRCKTVKGIVEGGGSARALIDLILEYHRNGEFPFDRLVRYYPLSAINDAVRDSCDGTVIKPVLLMAEGTG